MTPSRRDADQAKRAGTKKKNDGLKTKGSGKKFNLFKL